MIYLVVVVKPWRPYRDLVDLRSFDQQFAAVVGIAFRILISAVVQVTLTRHFAGCNRWGSSLVMRTALTLALLRDSTLGMCHNKKIYPTAGRYR